MGCTPSAPNETFPQNRLEIKLPSQPIILPDGFQQYVKCDDGTYRLKPRERPMRRVPKLGTVEESQILRRRQSKMKTVVSLPEIAGNFGSLSMNSKLSRMSLVK